MKLFIDIETAPALPPDYYRAHPDDMFVKRAMRRDQGITTVDQAWNTFGLSAETGIVICVSMSYYAPPGGPIELSKQDPGGAVRSRTLIADHGERVLLLELKEILDKASCLVAHNGKGFDYPFLCRRMVVNRIELPGVLQIMGRKPWEIPLEDTQEMWRFGDNRYTVSLDALCHLFDIESPKQDITGADVAGLYWGTDKDAMKRIATYCEGDVRALMQVYDRIVDYA